MPSKSRRTRSPTRKRSGSKKTTRSRRASPKRSTKRSSPTRSRRASPKRSRRSTRSYDPYAMESMSPDMIQRAAMMAQMQKEQLGQAYRTRSRSVSRNDPEMKALKAAVREANARASILKTASQGRKPSKKQVSTWEKALNFIKRHKYKLAIGATLAAAYAPKMKEGFKEHISPYFDPFSAADTNDDGIVDKGEMKIASEKHWFPKSWGEYLTEDKNDWNLAVEPQLAYALTDEADENMKGWAKGKEGVGNENVLEPSEFHLTDLYKTAADDTGKTFKGLKAEYGDKLGEVGVSRAYVNPHAGVPWRIGRDVVSQVKGTLLDPAYRYLSSED